MKTKGQSKDTSGTSDIINITEFRQDYHKDCLRTAEGLQNPEGLAGIGEGQSLSVPQSIREEQMRFIDLTRDFVHKVSRAGISQLLFVEEILITRSLQKGDQ